MSNYIKLSRTLLQSPCWLSEPFSMGQAWVDLLLQANWKDKEIWLDTNPILIKRGQFVTSEVKLAKRWRWSRGKVRRFLNGLKTVQQVVQQTDRVKSIITICNYEKYQGNSIVGETETVQQTDNQRTTDGTQLRIDKKDKNIKTPPAEDNSPLAPKNLKRKKETLDEILPNVWLCASDLKKLIDKIVIPEELKSLCMALSSYADKEPKKFKKYKDHYLVLLEWRERRHSEGKRFYNHPKTGWNYYNNREIDYAERDYGN